MLTDEEILELGDKTGAVFMPYGPLFLVNTGDVMVFKRSKELTYATQNLLKFARAIEAKIKSEEVL